MTDRLCVTRMTHFTGCPEHHRSPMSHAGGMALCTKHGLAHKRTTKFAAMPAPHTASDRPFECIIRKAPPWKIMSDETFDEFLRRFPPPFTMHQDAKFFLWENGPLAPSQVRALFELASKPDTANPSTSLFDFDDFISALAFAAEYPLVLQTVSTIYVEDIENLLAGIRMCDRGDITASATAIFNMLCMTSSCESETWYSILEEFKTITQDADELVDYEYHGVFVHRCLASIALTCARGLTEKVLDLFELLHCRFEHSRDRLMLFVSALGHVKIQKFIPEKVANYAFSALAAVVGYDSRVDGEFDPCEIFYIPEEELDKEWYQKCIDLLIIGFIKLNGSDIYTEYPAFTASHVSNVPRLVMIPQPAAGARTVAQKVSLYAQAGKLPCFIAFLLCAKRITPALPGEILMVIFEILFALEASSFPLPTFMPITHR